MSGSIRLPSRSRAVTSSRLFLLAVALLCAVQYGTAQNTPLISGGVGFFTSTPGGSTSYTPLWEPLIAAPIGSRFMIESRASIGEAFFPKGGGQAGYDHAHFADVTYLQGNYLVSPHLTIVAGSFLTPFATYNERLSPEWISNFQDGPLIGPLGTMSTATSLGGQLRGSAISRRKFSIDYAAYFSAESNHKQFDSERASGGRVSLYIPDARLEIGTSYGRLLQGVHENFYGTHVWWEPKDTAFRLRSEWARGAHAQGYWVEADYRTQAFGGLDSWIGRFEPVFRMEQTFRINQLGSDNLPGVNTQRANFALDYNLPHNTRILTSYTRHFASNGNENIWQTGIVYRFLSPAWKGK